MSEREVSERVDEREDCGRARERRPEDTGHMLADLPNEYYFYI